MVDIQSLGKPTSDHSTAVYVSHNQIHSSECVKSLKNNIRKKLPRYHTIPAALGSHIQDRRYSQHTVLPCEAHSYNNTFEVVF